MSFKVAAFLALFAVVSAQGLGSIAVQTQDGDTIVINQNTQQQVRIDTNTLSAWGAQQTIKVQVAGPTISPKTVHIVDEHVDYTGTLQSDILNQVLNEFNGRLTEDSYQQLLSVVAQQVASGRVNAVVLNALQTASNNRQVTQTGVHQLIQNVASKQQGRIQGQWMQDEISQQIKTQQVKQVLLSQESRGATLQAKLDAEQAAQALEGISPQSQTAKHVLISQALAASGNPVAAAQAELAAEQSAQTLQAVNPQSQLAKKVLISKALTQSGNKLAAAQVQLEAAKLAQIVSQQQGGFQGQGQQDKLAQQIKTQQIKQALLNQQIGGVGSSQAAVQGGLEAEQAAQSLEGITPQSQTAKQVLISQVLAASGNPVAAAQAQLAAEQSAEALQAINPQSQLAKKVLIGKVLAESGNPLAAAQVQLEAAEEAQIVATIESQGQFELGGASQLSGTFGTDRTAQSGRLSRLGLVQNAGQGYRTRSQYQGRLAHSLGLPQSQQQASSVLGLRGIPVAVY